MTRHTPHHEVELYREGESYVVIVELSGATAEDVDVDWIDGYLSVAAEVTGGSDDGSSPGGSRSRRRSTPPESPRSSTTAFWR